MAIVKGLKMILTLVIALSICHLSEGRVRELNNVATPWCIANPLKSTGAHQAEIDKLCNVVDCSPIKKGGSCFRPKTPNSTRFHASYVYNAYYQAKHKRDAYAVFTFMEPSTSTCKFLKD